MGITKVALPKYALGGLGMIPGTIVFVYFGTTVSNISDAAAGRFDGGVLQLVLLIGGSILAVIAVFYVSYVARKEVKKVLAKTEEEKKKAEESKKENGEDAETPNTEQKHNESNGVEVIDQEGGEEGEPNHLRAESIL